MLFRSKADRLITFLGIAGFIIFTTLFQQVFPSAAIDLSVPRQAIYQQAEASLRSHSPLEQEDIDTYQSVQRFDRDRLSSIYLQRTLGIPETNQLIQDRKLPLYFWSLRWFKPSQQEEFSLYLATTGEVLGYDHTIPESDPGASLTEAAARKIAETYLTAERGWDLGNWKLTDAAITQRPKRVDHTFDWKRRRFEAGEAELRLTVRVYGDRIGYYSHWLKIPESFARQFSEERSQASFFSNIFYLISFYGPLSVAFIFYVVAIARSQINWKSGLPPALIFFAVSMLARLNDLPLDKSYYSTTQNYTLFWIQSIYRMLFYTVSTAVPIYFLWMGGRQIAKQVWPQRDMILPRSPNRLAVFTQAYWRGMMMGGIGMGYLVLFYLVTTRLFSSWSPMGEDYGNLFSTPFPFLGPLRSGILPAVSEELQARLVGISFVLLLTGKLTGKWSDKRASRTSADKSTSKLTLQHWLALIIPGGIWAFAHLGYLSDPFYLRGIELWIPAVFLYGVFFLRFGLLSTVVGHCWYNALLGAGLLLKAQDAYLVASGVLVVVLLLLPLLPGLIQQWRSPHKIKQAQDALSIVSATSEDYVRLRRLPLINFEIADCFPQGEPSDEYEVVCLKAAPASNNAGGAIEGVGIAKLKMAAAANAATVQMLHVSPQYRRCYYGTQLVQALVQRLHQRGIHTITVETTSQQKSESLFWANQNWQTVSRKLLWR
ncbi:MAG: GNAT family N-acetyltransferase [Phormidesmis sp.]